MSVILELQELIREFVYSRDWKVYHKPKNLSMSIAIEAAELMELFQWDLEGTGEEKLTDDEFVEEVRMELADVLIYILSFANSTGIDIESAVRKKLEINKDRFPPIQ